MKKFLILLAAMAMTTMFAQANEVQEAASTIAAEAPAPTEGDTNGTTEEKAPEGK